jgi:hypothetical protein
MKGRVRCAQMKAPDRFVGWEMTLVLRGTGREADSKKGEPAVGLESPHKGQEEYAGSEWRSTDAPTTLERDARTVRHPSAFVDERMAQTGWEQGRWKQHSQRG